MASTVWRGNIAFGLVSIPVRLVRAARRERVKFHHVYREESEPETEFRPTTGRVEPVEDADTVPEYEPPARDEQPAAAVQRVHNVASVGSHSDGAAVAVRPGEILKGYEIEPDRYVTFQAKELKAIKPDTSTTVEIASFLHAEEIDPLFFDASYYVVPQAAGEKPYAVLFGSLRDTGFAGLGQMAMHGREHSVLIRAGAKGLLLHTLFYQNEVHAEDEYTTGADLVTASELKMADAFVKALASFDPQALVDRYEQRLKALIESRSRAASGVAAPPAREQARPVVDIMEALRKSLEQVRKPPVKETRPKRRRAS